MRRRLSPKAHVNRGNALKDLGHLDAAGAACADSPRFDEAMAAYDKAIKLDPQLAEALSRARLAQSPARRLGGRFSGLRASRKSRRTDLCRRCRSRAGTATPLAAERLVLVTEQGLGDTIQFCRFAPAAGGARLRRDHPDAQGDGAAAVDASGVTIETDHDKVAQDRKVRWLPLLSVPGMLGITPDTVPADVPYLAAEPARVEAWRRAARRRGFKIGINWSSGHSDKPHFTRRDIPLAEFAALAALPGVQLISLQKGPAAAQIGEVAFGNKIVTLECRSRTPTPISSSTPPR